MLPESKSDQLQESIIVYIFRRNISSCPLALVSKYIEKKVKWRCFWVCGLTKTKKGKNYYHTLEWTKFSKKFQSLLHLICHCDCIVWGQEEDQ